MMVRVPFKIVNICKSADCRECVDKCHTSLVWINHMQENQEIAYVKFIGNKGI